MSQSAIKAGWHEPLASDSRDTKVVRGAYRTRRAQREQRERIQAMPDPASPSRFAAALASLSPREREILDAICRSGSYPEAAEVLSITLHRAHTAMGEISRILGIDPVPGSRNRDRTRVICYRLGRHHGLVTRSEEDPHA